MNTLFVVMEHGGYYDESYSKTYHGWKSKKDAELQIDILNKEQDIMRECNVRRQQFSDMWYKQNPPHV